jgi:CheY-like chemotaxis protein
MTLHIGVIDDDRGILYTLEAMGTTAGWRMHSTTEPEECLSWVRHDEIDMLLVDYHMPVMNGRQIIKRVRALNTRVILIALTVEDDPSLASELILAGADDFITKPVRLADFAPGSASTNASSDTGTSSTGGTKERRQPRHDAGGHGIRPHRARARRLRRRGRRMRARVCHGAPIPGAPRRARNRHTEGCRRPGRTSGTTQAFYEWRP